MFAILKVFNIFADKNVFQFERGHRILGELNLAD